MVPKCIYNCLCQVWVLCKKSHTAAALCCLNAFSDFIAKILHGILFENIVSKYGHKILSQNMVTKHCLAILSQNFVWMPFGFYCPDSAQNIVWKYCIKILSWCHSDFITEILHEMFSFLSVTQLKLHIPGSRYHLVPYLILSFISACFVSFSLSNPCTITLDPTEPRTVTVEHIALATRPSEMDVAPQADQLIPTIFSKTMISPTISLYIYIHEM